MRDPWKLTKNPDAPLDVVAIECLGLFALRYLVNPLYMLRIRSDELLKNLAGTPPPFPDYFDTPYTSFVWAGTTNPDLRLRQIRSFWMTNFSDSVLTFYRAGAAVVSPYAAPGFSKSDDLYKLEFIEGFCRQHTRLEPLALEEKCANWLAIDALLRERYPAARKAVVFYDHTRIPNEQVRRLLCDSERAMLDVLPALGWRCYAMPPNSPPRGNGDAYWGHYDRGYSFRYTKTCVTDLFGSRGIPK